MLLPDYAGAVMRKHEFATWLGQKYPFSGGTAGSRLSNGERIKEIYGDLDRYYREDRLQHLLSCLAYSAADERANRPNPSKIPINGNLRNGLATLRNAVSLYREFSDGVAPAATTARHSQGTRLVSAWPEWAGPNEADLLRLAHLTMPYVRFLNPQIVRAVVDDNERRRPY